MRVLALILTCLSVGCLAQKPEIFSTDEGAIRGYDPVAFFNDSKPVAGKREFSYSWNSATWLFSSKDNLEAFKRDPEKYAPQYGGYCAWGMSNGYKAPTLPETWTILDGKLYFNYNATVQKKWNVDQKGFIEKADKNWPTVKKE